MMCDCARPSPVTRGLLAFLLSAACAASIAHAQSTNIVATPPGAGGLGTSLNTAGNTTNITGGTRPGAGPNLFHSFNQFSVGTGDVAAFVNPGGVSKCHQSCDGRRIAVEYLRHDSGAQCKSVFPQSCRDRVRSRSTIECIVVCLFQHGSATAVRLGMAYLPLTPIYWPWMRRFRWFTRCHLVFSGQGLMTPIVLTSSGTLLQANVVVGLWAGPIQINGSKITAQRIIVGSTGSAGEISAQPAVGNPFSGACRDRVSAGTARNTSHCGWRGVIPASVDLLPGNMTVPSGAQVNRTTDPGLPIG